MEIRYLSASKNKVHSPARSRITLIGTILTPNYNKLFRETMISIPISLTTSSCYYGKYLLNISHSTLNIYININNHIINRRWLHSLQNRFYIYAYARKSRWLMPDTFNGAKRPFYSTWSMGVEIANRNRQINWLIKNNR